MLNQNTIHNILKQFNDNTLSLYLRVDPSYSENHSQTPAWNIWLKNALKDIETNLDESQKPLWGTILKRLNAHFNAYQPGGRTLVIFMDDKHEHIQEITVAMQHRSHFGKPLVSPLLWAIDEYQRYLIVMVDQQKAIFRTAYLGNLDTEAEMTIDLAYDWGEKTLMPASNADNMALNQGNNRDAFDDMIAAHVDRFYKDVANEIDTIFKDDQPMRLILAGDERSAHALHDKLHESITDYFVAILSIPMNANDKTIMQQIWKTCYNYEREREYDLMKQITTMAYANGRGVLGRDDLETAMQMQQVELIVMPFSLLEDDSDYAHELAMWALENNRNIKFVHGEAARQLKHNGGIAARLYYSIEAV